MRILKRLKIWISFKALKAVRGALKEGVDEELEKILNEALVEFYVRKELNEEDRELIGLFIEFAGEDLVPHLLERVELRLREER